MGGRASQGGAEERVDGHGGRWRGEGEVVMVSRQAVWIIDILCT